MSPVNNPAARLHLVEQLEATPARSQPALSQPVSLEINTRNALRWYALTDALSFILGMGVAWLIASMINGIYFARPASDIVSEYGSFRLVEFIMIACATLAWFQHTGHYRVRMPFWMEIKKIVCALGLAMLADGFLQFAAKQDFSRIWLMSGWIITACVMIAGRNYVRAYLRRRGAYTIRALLVGSGETAQQTKAALAAEPCLGYEIISEMKDLPEAFLQAGKSWQTLCRAHGAEYVIIALDGQDMAAASQPLHQLVREAVPFSVSPPLSHLPVIGMMPHYFLNHDVMLLARASGLEQPLPCVLKRTTDILAAGMALILLSPLLLALALLVRQDGGKAFYGHKRLGRGGRHFYCLKFRSMIANGDEVLERHLAENPEARTEWEASRKLKNDPRVTRIGDFLRRSSLDELPQLINVLRGDMSLVGPRPIVMAEVANYDGDIAHYFRVRPGITGLWQVSGRSDVSYPQRVHMDSWYVRNWSLWHDIAIICKTVPALLKRQGAC